MLTANGCGLHPALFDYWCPQNFNDNALFADLMGHESIETTRIYLRRTATEQRQIVDRVITW